MNVPKGHLTQGAYASLVTVRKANHQPIPPAEHFKHAGHHWLAYRPPHSGGGATQTIMVAQWSPVECLWYHSDTLATSAMPIGRDGLMTHWEWVAHIPVPEGI